MNGSNILTVFRRECAAYFHSLAASLYLVCFIALNTGFFMMAFFWTNRADMRSFFSALPFFAMVFIPAVTMRQWAEEKRGNTLELLLTFPMNAWEIAAGKFLAALMVYILALLGTLTLPVMLFSLSHPDGGFIAGGYLGSLCLGAFFIALGLLISGFCRDQISAFVITAAVLFSIYGLGSEAMASLTDGWIPGAGSFLQRALGTQGYFERFSQGLIDFKAVFYFLSGTFIFLALNGLWLEGRMRPGAFRFFFMTAGLAVAIFITANSLLSEFSWGRWDLTEGKVNTLSPVTKKILQNLDRPVMIRFYVSPSEKMPTAMKTLERDVLDKLKDLKEHSRGRLDFQYFHIDTADPREKDLALKGVQPFQVQAIEADEVALRLVYGALVISYKEKPDQVLPRLLPDSLHQLEYWIVSRIYKMTLERVPAVAMVAPFQMRSLTPEMKALLEQAGSGQTEALRDDPYEFAESALRFEGYQVSRIRLSEEEPIPEGTDILLILEPSRLSERQRYEINRFLVEGGSLFLAVQNYEMNYGQAGAKLILDSQEKQPGVNELLEHWGLSVNPSYLADSQNEILKASDGSEQAIPIQLPIQIVVPPSGMNHERSVTNRLSSFFYLWGSALTIEKEKLKAQGLRDEVLLTSSRQSWLVPYRSGNLLAGDFSNVYQTQKGPFPLAVMVEGTFKDVFQNQKVPGWEKPLTAKTGASSSLKQNPLKTASGRLLLIGAAIPFQRNAIQVANNFSFFMNAMDTLGFKEDLVKIRAAKQPERVIGRLPASVKIFWRLLAAVIVPAFYMAAGILYLTWRRKKRHFEAARAS